MFDLDYLFVSSVKFVKVGRTCLNVHDTTALAVLSIILADFQESEAQLCSSVGVSLLLIHSDSLGKAADVQVLCTNNFL
jgi:hypothetical protein